MKKISVILMAFAMALTMTQCKKNEATDQGETVTITLDVKQHNGAKVNVDPTIGTVDFETGDKVYVGSGGKFVGFLTHNGTNFVGNITNPTEGQPLQFYFLGNVTPQETLGAGTTEECSVVISDQTEHLPVISCAPSFENYESGVTSYTGHLLNKCALVKFNVTTPSNSPICITGMKNKVTVDFSQNTVTPSMDGEGVIKLPAGAGENVEKWVILLPQEAIGEGEEGTAYTENGAYSGTRDAVPTIGENGYYDTGIEVNVTAIAVIDHGYVDLGLPSGTLWATCNVGANSPEEYGDCFAWGETQPKENYDWNTYQYCNGSYNTLTKYCTDSDLGYNGFTDNLTTLLPDDDAATAIWGSDWRIPTKAEWVELYNNTTVTWTTQNSVNGRLFTASNGNSLFLPAAGCHRNSSFLFAGSAGGYRSSSLDTDNPYLTWIHEFGSNSYHIVSDYRYFGQSVRPVLSAPQNNTPIGAINGLFTINSNGDQVYFSHGNLQYQASTSTWQFAENQWDYVGTDNTNISQTYSGWIDLFGWGTSGYNHGATCYQPWSTDQTDEHYYAYGSPQNNLYDQTGKADWGYNAISNGGNQSQLWRTLSTNEWTYIFNNRTTQSGVRYALGIVNGVTGLIVLPDNWDSSVHSFYNPNSTVTPFWRNAITLDEWTIMESYGAVFMPTAGYRYGTTVWMGNLSSTYGYYGFYWTSSCGVGNDNNAGHFEMSNASFFFVQDHRHYGFSVRLVQDYNR